MISQWKLLRKVTLISLVGVQPKDLPLFPVFKRIEGKLSHLKGKIGQMLVVQDPSPEGPE